MLALTLIAIGIGLLAACGVAIYAAGQRVIDQANAVLDYERARDVEVCRDGRI